MSISDNEWDLIVERIADGRCIPFLGAGASFGAGVPTAEMLATELAAKCRYPLADKKDFLRVCQFFSMVRDRDSVAFEVARKVGGFTDPGIVHHVLAALPFPIVLTTNFDTLMESAFQRAGKGRQVVKYRPSGDNLKHAASDNEVGRPHSLRPLVYKLHGDVDDHTSMVVTEDDVVNFIASVLRQNPPLPFNIKTIFEQDSILFIGYGLKDWNIRVLLRALRVDTGVKSFAIQRRPNRMAVAREWEETVMHLRNRSLYSYDMDAVEFAQQLYDHFKRAHPDKTQDLPE